MEENSFDVPESPRKRMKLSLDGNALNPTPDRFPNSHSEPMQTAVEPVQEHSAPRRPILQMASLTQAATEAEVGITEFVNARSPGFTGVLKKR